jgi:hypothetical protein
MFKYNLEHIFILVPRPPHNVRYSLSGDLATLDMTDATYWSVTWSRRGPFSITSFPTLVSHKKINKTK